MINRGKRLNRGACRLFLLIAISALSQPAVAEADTLGIGTATNVPQVDKRTLLTVPYEDREHLLHTMRMNLVNLGRLISAMAEDDFRTVEKITDKMSLSEKKLKGLARRGNTAFAAMGLQFHGLKVLAVKKAAEAKDRKATLRAMSQMVKTCIACHATFKVMEWPDDKSYIQPEAVPLALPQGIVMPLK